MKCHKKFPILSVVLHRAGEGVSPVILSAAKDPHPTPVILSAAKDLHPTPVILSVAKNPFPRNRIPRRSSAC